jgi:hypothetical protein
MGGAKGGPQFVSTEPDTATWPRLRRKDKRSIVAWSASPRMAGDARETRSKEGMRTLPILSIVAMLEVACGDSQSIKSVNPFNGPSPFVSLRLDSPRPGSTNAGVMPSMVLWGYELGSRARIIAQDLEARALFVSADGSAVPAAPITPPVGPKEYNFVLQPSVPLLMDTWYDLTYPSGPIYYAADGIDGAVLQVTPVISSTFKSYLSEGILTRFFTGSAPQLSMLMVAEGKDGGAEPPNLLYISMSEPVSIEDLLLDGLVVSAGRPVNGILIGCVVALQDCREPPPVPAAARSEVSWFQYQLDEPLPPQFELALALSLRGSARTVQWALDAGAVRGTTTVSDGYLRYPMDVSSWRQRNGSLFGWSNVE